MTALTEVADYVPDQSVEIADLAEELGVSAADLRIFHRYFDLHRIRLAPDKDLRGLMVAAADALTGLRGNEHRVRYVLAGRTIGTVGRVSKNALHEACDELGLGHAVALTVTEHACASGLLAVDLAGRLLAADGDPDALALVLTGEKATIPGSRMIPGTTVMGESSAACLVRAGGGPGELLGYAARTHGEYHRVTPPKELAVRFGQQYLSMLVDAMRAAVAAAGIDFADLALILPHNVNRYSWSRVCQQLGLPLDRVHLDNVPELGHCFGADAFLNLADALRRGRLAPGDHYLMAGVGLGATFSAMVFRH
ncbi:3-oxoacyl-[acyl-carrier-protein] synthase III C-terminal domain-containing protein [Streptacidiphilus rugosus]|uniref:3-oxoacyl-[acyl-carrier-protein] synthase III C-terminal domain-containing protein n=1 Tax=Streptacidiphilus rugosus TaxID=405783 RepID=UPI000561B86E|nr:3-oxoacyl-[acyl-carrier-protein] synthase III C-terminal domain-containing protein [Streptacidiphilus rugosus]